MELRPFPKELFNETSDVRANAPRVDAVVVVQIFKREGGKERVHPTQLVEMN